MESMFSSTVSKNRKSIEMLLVVLILISFAPTEVLGPRLDAQLKGAVGPILSPIKTIMSNIFVRLFLWLVLLWACCSVKDMGLFYLVAIYFLVAGQ